MKRDSTYEITWLVRRLFRAMAARADEHLEGSSLSVADRAVMEFLYPDERLTVPAIASRYQVSRQHVQVTVNRLLERQLLQSVANPRHKRSPLIALTPDGQDQFAAIRDGEAQLLDALFAGIDDRDLDITKRTLGTLYRRLT